MTAIQILEKCEVSGNTVRLPKVQLERKEFEDIQKLLLNAGAAKKGTMKNDFRFEFKTEAQPIVDKLTGGDKINIKKEFQFFETPKELAQRIVKIANLQPTDKILEPEAGQAGIADYVPIEFRKNLSVIEINDVNRQILTEKGYNLIGSDFLNPDLSNTAQQFQFDKIVANPPFSGNQDILHVKEMYNCLKTGGRIVTVMSNHWQISNNKKETEFRDWLNELDFSIEELPAGTFKESGTMIAACLVVIDK